MKNQRAKNQKMRWKLKKKEGEDLPRVKRDRTHPERELERERVSSQREIVRVLE